jgi:prepilin signal peptidase PulO-like enzyme (type II secretory pathway)
MSVILFIFVFVFGSIIGSFLNVVILRYGTGRGYGGRSKCAVTGKTLQWFELIPILSFLIQGGRTRHGGARISWQYPLVEFFTGVGFVTIVHKFFPLLYLQPQSFLLNIFFYFTVYSILLVIFVYDYKHQIIPDDFLYPLAILSIIALFYSGAPLMYFMAGPLLALPLLLLWYVTRGQGMGFGDVKLMLPLGWILGISYGFAGLLLAFWTGALVGLTLMSVHAMKWKTRIPFGPFIIIGAVIAFLYNIDMHAIAMFFARLI